MERSQKTLSQKLKSKRKKLIILLLSIVVFIVTSSISFILWELHQPHKLSGMVTDVSWNRIDNIPESDGYITVDGQEIKISQWPGNHAFDEWSYNPITPRIKVGDYVTVTYVDPPKFYGVIDNYGGITTDSIFIRPKSLNCEQCSVVVNKR